MSCNPRIIAVLAAALQLAACASQQLPGVADPGLFLVEDSKGEVVSYLLGSLHVAPYAALPDGYVQRIRSSRTLVREAIPPDELTLEKAGFLLTSADSASVWSGVNATAQTKIREKVDMSLEDRGLNLSMNKLQPWAALLVYQQTFADGGMDTQIGELFKEENRLGLERVDELGFMFSELSQLSLDEISQRILAIPEDQSDFIASETSRYLTGNLLTNEGFIRDSNDSIIARRNEQIWLPRLLEYFDETNTARRPYIVVVGQLHFPGKKGLLALLAANDFVLKRLDVDSDTFRQDDIRKYQ